MTVTEYLSSILTPALAWCQTVPGWSIPDDERATLMLLVIPKPESDYSNIAQIGGGPGRGFYQFGMPTIGLILTNPVSSAMAAMACRTLYVVPTSYAAYTHLLLHPYLQVAMARLDLRCDSHALPTFGDEEAAWECYVRVWRPGTVINGGQRAAEERARWTPAYAEALAAMA